jgi:hypothetical protein
MASEVVGEGVIGDALIPVINRLQDIFSQVCVRCRRGVCVC